MKINAYINFNGKTEEAFNFYKSVLGGEFDQVMRFGDAPSDQKLDASEAKKIMHISYPVGDTYLMGSDVPQSMKPVNAGDNITMNITVTERAEADSIFKGLSEGGKITMPLADTFWGAYFGMFTDKFQVNWMVNCDSKK